MSHFLFPCTVSERSSVSWRTLFTVTKKMIGSFWFSNLVSTVDSLTYYLTVNHHDLLSLLLPW